MYKRQLQDTWLYNGTILENIRYGRLAASDEDVLAAAKAAQVDHFVRTLSQGCLLYTSWTLAGACSPSCPARSWTVWTKPCWNSITAYFL